MQAKTLDSRFRGNDRNFTARITLRKTAVDITVDYIASDSVLKNMIPGKPQAATAPLAPPLFSSLLDAAQSGRPLETLVMSVVRSLGFDSFMYGMSTVPQPFRESRSYVWTTLPREWVAIYDQQAYIEIDPRLTHCWNRVTPYLWDRHVGEKEPRIAAFLEHAAAYGVGSGIVVPLRDPLHPLILVALNSIEREISARRHREINAALGDIVLVASHFHELFMAKFVDPGVPPRQQGASLSAREAQCLRMAARGLTSADIGRQLGVVERTVNFHFCNVISKLAVANRQEAIAVAIGQGIIST